MPSLPTEATIGNIVFLDANANGIQDAGEAGLGGVIANLLKDSVQVDTTTTSSAAGFIGAYSFSVVPGTYSVQFVLPSGYFFPPKGTDSDAKPDSPNQGETTPVTVTSGGSADLTAGMYLSEWRVAWV